MFDTDVFVIGGGPAGIAAAMAARRKGLRVILADGNRPPIDKACGEGLMPDSIAAARAIGIELPEKAGFRFRGVRFDGGGYTVCSNFPQGTAVGFRRTVLHREMVEQAGRAGVELLWSTPVAGIGHHTVDLKGGSISTRWIVGADGSGSRVRRWAGLDRFARNSRRFGYRRHYARKPWTDYMEIYWGDGCQIYVTPIGADEICVALISRSPSVRLDQALARFPVLQSHLAGVPVSSHERGAVTAMARLRSVARGNLALVGDASGSVDAITGEGLCQAFRQSAALADALESGDLTGYSNAHRRIAFRPSLMADMMLAMDRWSVIQQRALRAMALRPKIFENMLAGHVGELNPMQFVRASGWLALQIVKA